MQPGFERRAEVRHSVSVAASLWRPDGEKRLSLIRDLSTSGARMLVTSGKLHVGDAVRVRLCLNYGVQCEATGQLLRVVMAGEAGMWKREVAVRFHDRLDVGAIELAT